MSPQLVSILAQVLASDARVQGMMAENATREGGGNSPAYGQVAFDHEAAHLDMLATDARNAQ